MKEKQVDILLDLADFMKLLLLGFGGAFLSAHFFWTKLPLTAADGAMKENEALRENVLTGSAACTILFGIFYLGILVGCNYLALGVSKKKQKHGP